MMPSDAQAQHHLLEVHTVVRRRRLNLSPSPGPQMMPARTSARDRAVAADLAPTAILIRLHLTAIVAAVVHADRGRHTVGDRRRAQRLGVFEPLDLDQLRKFLPPLFGGNCMVHLSSDPQPTPDYRAPERRAEWCYTAPAKLEFNADSRLPSSRAGCNLPVSKKGSESCTVSLGGNDGASGSHPFHGARSAVVDRSSTRSVRF